MTCYAMACRQPNPCLNSLLCERVWHLCEVDHQYTVKHWLCPVCDCWWHMDSHGVWHRNPITTLTGV